MTHRLLNRFARTEVGKVQPSPVELNLVTRIIAKFACVPRFAQGLRFDGIDAARAIRVAEREMGRPRTPILALTANALSHQVDEYMAAGMDGHIAKPIEIAKLYDAISRALTLAATTSAIEAST